MREKTKKTAIIIDKEPVMIFYDKFFYHDIDIKDVVHYLGNRYKVFQKSRYGDTTEIYLKKE